MAWHPNDAAWLARTACSSSFVALHDAVVDLQRGRVEYAVVGGSSAIFRPATSLAFLRLKCAYKAARNRFLAFRIAASMLLLLLERLRPAPPGAGGWCGMLLVCDRQEIFLLRPTSRTPPSLLGTGLQRNSASCFSSAFFQVMQLTAQRKPVGEMQPVASHVVDQCGNARAELLRLQQLTQ